jgi:hypothetical protein
VRTGARRTSMGDKDAAPLVSGFVAFTVPLPSRVYSTGLDFLFLLRVPGQCTLRETESLTALSRASPASAKSTSTLELELASAFQKATSFRNALK